VAIANVAEVGNGTILIVDDDPDMLLLLTRWLEDAGFKVVAVNSGVDALARLQSSRPDLVVTDLYMEEMDGMTLVTRIHAANPLTPVIMLSGKAQIPDAVKATHLGTSAFLTKPIAKERLLEEIDRHIRPRRHTTHGAFGNTISLSASEGVSVSTRAQVESKYSDRSVWPWPVRRRSQTRYDGYLA